MKILVLHNHYQQAGGEDRVFEAETVLLEAKGHHVIKYEISNDSIASMNAISVAQKTLWNRSTYSEIRNVIRSEKPHIAHFHNTLPLMSPSAYHAVKDESIAVVKTLHNYRLLCPNGLFFRDGHVCENCMGKFFPLPGIVHQCYRNSRRASAAVATMIAFHRLIGTWNKTIDLFIAPSEFARQKMIRGGMPERKIVVKPNFVYPEMGDSCNAAEFGLFVGRLSVEKGIRTVLDAWTKNSINFPLVIVGDGPEIDLAKTSHPQITALGWKTRQEVFALMKRASFLVFPSIWYENLPMTIIEAFSTGLPVIAGNLGSMRSIVDHERTGLLFTANDPLDLTKQIKWLLNNNEKRLWMGKEARKEFETRYSAEKNYETLMDIYKRAIAIQTARQKNL